MLKNATRANAALLALGIFVLGIVVGATYHRWLPDGKRQWTRERPGRHGAPLMGATSERLLKRYTRNLELTEDQQAEIERILDESRETMGDVRKGIRARIDSVTRKTWARIRDALRPDQQERFDELTSPVSPKNIQRRLVKRLELNQEQQAQVSRILKENWAWMKKMRRKIREKIRANEKNTYTEVYNVLTPEQMKQYKMKKPVPSRRFYRRWDLDLSDEQRAKIEQIEKKNRQATRRLFQERDEQLALIAGKTWSEIKTHLHSDQVDEFDRIIEDVDGRIGWKRQFRRRPGSKPFAF